MVLICSHHHLELPTGILSCSFHHAKSASPNTFLSIVLPVYLRWHLGHLQHFFHLQFFQSRSAAVGRWEKNLPNKTDFHPWNLKSEKNLDKRWQKHISKYLAYAKNEWKPQTNLKWKSINVWNLSVFWSVLCQALLSPSYWENGSHMFSSPPGTTYRHSKFQRSFHHAKSISPNTCHSIVLPSVPPLVLRASPAFFPPSFFFNPDRIEEDVTGDFSKWAGKEVGQALSSIQKLLPMPRHLPHSFGSRSWSGLAITVDPQLRIAEPMWRHRGSKISKQPPLAWDDLVRSLVHQFAIPSQIYRSQLSKLLVGTMPFQTMQEKRLNVGPCEKGLCKRILVAINVNLQVCTQIFPLIGIEIVWVRWCPTQRLVSIYKSQVHSTKGRVHFAQIK